MYDLFPGLSNSRNILLNIISLLALFVVNSNLVAEAKVKIDGSSTVYPITEAVAEEFGLANKGAKVTVGVSGTGGGFKKFCRGETDISNASRPIKGKEAKVCKENGIDFIEVPVAYDAISVVINKSNSFAKDITIAELKKLWSPEAKGKISKWSDVRAGWPDSEIELFGPGVDSGTFDYFTEVVVGKSQASRSDFTSSEDDNVLVQGVAGNKNALGFFGLAYYQENIDKVAALPVDDSNDSNGKGAVKPSAETVIAGHYKPLSRPLFIYISSKSLEKELIKNFANFYLEQAGELAAEVGYVRLEKEKYAKAKAQVAAATKSIQ